MYSIKHFHKKHPLVVFACLSLLAQVKGNGSLDGLDFDAPPPSYDFDIGAPPDFWDVIDEERGIPASLTQAKEDALAEQKQRVDKKLELVTRGDFLSDERYEGALFLGVSDSIRRKWVKSVSRLKEIASGERAVFSASEILSQSKLSFFESFLGLEENLGDEMRYMGEQGVFPHVIAGYLLKKIEILSDERVAVNWPTLMGMERLEALNHELNELESPSLPSSYTDIDDLKFRLRYCFSVLGKVSGSPREFLEFFGSEEALELLILELSDLARLPCPEMEVDEYLGVMDDEYRDRAQVEMNWYQDGSPKQIKKVKEKYREYSLYRHTIVRAEVIFKEKFLGGSNRRIWQTRLLPRFRWHSSPGFNLLKQALDESVSSLDQDLKSYLFPEGEERQAVLRDNRANVINVTYDAGLGISDSTRAYLEKEWWSNESRPWGRGGKAIFEQKLIRLENHLYSALPSVDISRGSLPHSEDRSSRKLVQYSAAVELDLFGSGSYLLAQLVQDKGFIDQLYEEVHWCVGAGVSFDDLIDYIIDRIRYFTQVSASWSWAQGLGNPIVPMLKDREIILATLVNEAERMGQISEEASFNHILNVLEKNGRNIASIQARYAQTEVERHKARANAHSAALIPYFRERARLGDQMPKDEDKGVPQWFPAGTHPLTRDELRFRGPNMIRMVHQERERQEAQRQEEERQRLERQEEEEERERSRAGASVGARSP